MEKLVRFVVSNRTFTLIFVGVITMIAWVKLPTLTIKQNPSVDLPTLMITATLPGASAREIEQRVVTKIEDKLESTRLLKKFDSKIRNSVASITMEYQLGIDIDDEYTDINSKLNNLKSDLPKDTEIIVIKQSPIDIMVAFVLAVVSDTANQSEISLVAERLKADLRQIKAIENVSLIEPEEEVRIDLDISRMSAYGIDVHQVGDAIRGNNRFLPTGNFRFGDKNIAVLPFSGGYHDLEALRDTILISRTGSALALRDVASIALHSKPDSVITQVEGRPSTWITMRLNSEANVFEVKNQLDAILEAHQQGLLDRGYEVRWLFEMESGVAYKMSQLIGNIMQGILILSIVLLFAVGYRSAFVISMMLPLALGLSIVGLALTDYGLQGVSLAGFIIALGLIVDNGIVVTENTFKLQHYQGLDAKEAAIQGTSSVLAPLLSSTLTTALAFAPLFFMDSVTGLFLRSLVTTIWLCLAASLIVAVVFSSLMLSRIGTENKLWKLPSPPSFMNALRPFRDHQYASTVRWFITHPWALLAIVIFLMWLTGRVAAQLPVIVFPDSEEPYFTVSIEAPADRSLEYTSQLTNRVSEITRGFEEVDYCASVVTQGFPFVDTGIKFLDHRRHNAQLFCSVGFRDSTQLANLTDRVNLELDQFAAEATVTAAPFAVGGEAGGSDVEILVSGPRIETVREQARIAEDAIQAASLAGIRNISNPARSPWFALDIRFKERVANALGVNRGQVDQVLVLLTHGSKVDQLRTKEGNDYDIVLRAENSFEEPLAVFDRLFVTSNTGDHIPLSQVIEVSFAEDEYDIEHKLFRPLIKIGIGAQPGADVNELTRQIEAITDTLELPQGYSLSYEGQLAKTAEEFSSAGKYVGIIGLTILGIFVLQFKSVLQPLVVCAAIPLSFIGAFMLLYGWSQPMSFLAFIGLTSLMGIVVNNSILLVDEGNQLQFNNPELGVSEAAVKAGVNRFMPILLTSITSIVGLLPLALGNSMFKALAVVVIGGLTTSTFLTLICVPVLYAKLTRGKVAAPVTGNWTGDNSLGERES
jgi:multidrug efflux pump subunit AcrB